MSTTLFSHSQKNNPVKYLQRSILTSISIFTFSLLAQSQEHPNWSGLMHSDSLTLNELIDEHRALWPMVPTERGQGYKQFERYRALQESRLNDAGKPLTGEEIIRQWEEVRAYSATRSLGGNWQPLGPILDDVTTRDHIEGVGRMDCLEFHPSDPNIVFAGSPAGGLWRSFDGGATWSSNTDWLPTLGVSSIAFDPTNPQIVYIGTGDFDASDAPGMGVMRRIDRADYAVTMRSTAVATMGW